MALMGSLGLGLSNSQVIMELPKKLLLTIKLTENKIFFSILDRFCRKLKKEIL